MVQIFYALVFLLLSFYCLPEAMSTTYYVDPTSGNNSNNGTFSETPWASLPGTRNAGDTGYDCPDTTGSKISGDDIIYLKSGETHIARKIVIDSTYYQSGTSGHPIIIRRKTDWGSGSFTFSGTGITFGTYSRFIYIDNIGYITIDGVAGVSSSYDGIIVSNVVTSNGIDGGLMYRGNTQASPTAGFTIQYVKFYNVNGPNLTIQRASNFSVSYVECDGADSDLSVGFYTGGQTSGNSTGTFTDCLSHDHGNTPSGGGGGGSVKHGFWTTDSTNITFTRCTSYDNEGDGFDTGTVSSTPSDNIIYYRCKSYNNDDGFAANVDDISGNSRFYFLYCLSYKNNNGLNIYNGPTAYIYNCTLAKNNMGIYSDAPAYSNRNMAITIKNTIFYENNIVGGTNDGDFVIYTTNDLTYVGDYNLFDQGSGDEKLVRWCIIAIGCSSVSYYYSTTDASNIVAWRTDRSQDANSYDSVEYSRSVDFTDASNNVYTLLATSDAINAGTDLTLEWPSGIPMLDFVGNPKHAAWDIGAYEYISPSTITGLAITGGSVQ